MKVGIKIWSTNKRLIAQSRKYYEQKQFDFIEISAIKGTFDTALLEQIKGIPCIVHIDNNKVNFGHPEFQKETEEALQEVKKFADYLSAPYIILHPGYGEIHFSLVRELLEKYADSRFCMENMPGKTVDLKYEATGRTTTELCKYGVHKFCVDFAHAVKASITLDLDPYEHIKSLLSLQPKIFHACDCDFEYEIDIHKHIGEGEIDFRRILSMIADKNQYISVETPKPDYSSLESDIQNVKKIKELLQHS